MHSPKLQRRILILVVLFTVWFTGTILFIALDGHHLAIAVGTAGISIALYIAYWIASKRAYTERGHVNALPRHPETADTMRQVESLCEHVTVEQAAFYIQMILEPRTYTVRIGERILPSTRSYEVTTSHSLILPRELLDTTAIVPLMLVEKGHLLDLFSVHGNDGGKRYSTLSQDQTIVHTATVIRCLVRHSGRQVADLYSENVEAQLLDYLAHPGKVAADDGSFHDLMRAVVNLTDGGLDRRTAMLITRLLRALRLHYPVVIVEPEVASSSESKHIDGGIRLRIKVQRREIPVPNQKATSLEGLIEFVRVAMGVSSARILWPLENAAAARSYHLETLGPQDTYLARQAIVHSVSGDAQSTVSVQQRALQRRGQRYSHLYIHDRREDPLRPLTYVAVFYERPPGSIAPATLSAFASLTLLLIAAIARQTKQIDIHADLVAVLLAVPVVISAWTGFERSGGPFGRSLGAKASQVCTMVLSIAGAAWYVLGPHPESNAEFAVHWTDRPGTITWILIVSASLYAFLMSAASWFIRAHVYRHFLTNDQTADVG
jgi:hypothetical protein